MSYVYKFQNRRTGEVLEASPDDLRIGRMRKRLRAWGRAARFRGDTIFVTLTYRPGQEWAARHVSAFMKRVRRHLDGALFAYCWVAELQRRGAVHYHIVLLVAPGTRIPKPDEAGWWSYGFTRVERVGAVGSLSGYLRKYISKTEETGKFPVGLRLFAVAIRKQFAAQRWQLRWLSAPSWFRAEVESSGAVVAVGVVFRKVVGGWEWLGEFFESPWSVVREWATDQG